jgi:hypothetical protein
MHTTQQAIAIGNDSREFKRAVNGMRMAMKDFSAAPKTSRPEASWASTPPRCTA